MQKHELNSLPKSLAEARSLGHNLYFTGVACKHGHSTYRYVADRICAECAKAKVKKAATIGGGNSRRWANKTSEQLAAIYAKRKAYYYKTRANRLAEKKASYEKLMQNPERVLEYRKKIKAYRAAVGRAPEVSNPVVKRRYKQTVHGKAVTRTNDAKRRAEKLKRTPIWLTMDDLWMIKQAHELAVLRTKLFGFSWHVDHVVPLQGKIVSGLHTPYNLQVIPAVVNTSKSNKFVPA